jgi:hypothetical protein
VSIDEMIALEEYQRVCAGATERQITTLMETINQLTDYTKAREGRQILRANRHQLVEAMKKLHDIFIEMEGT